MEASEGGTVLVKLNLQPGAATSTADSRHDPVLRQELLEEFCSRCVEGAGARPNPATKQLLASFFPGLSQDSHDLIKPLTGSLLVSADVGCPEVPPTVASDQIKMVRTIAPYAALAHGGGSSASASRHSATARQHSSTGAAADEAKPRAQHHKQPEQKLQQPSAVVSEPRPLLPPVAVGDPAAPFLHAAYQYTFPFCGTPLLKTAPVVTQLQAAAVAQHTANPRHHWLPPKLTGEDGGVMVQRREDDLEGLLPQCAGWGVPAVAKAPARPRGMCSSSGYAADGTINTSGDPVVDLQQELQLPPQAVITAQAAFADSFCAWAATLHASSLTAAGLRRDDISATQELLSSPAVTRLSMTLALYIWVQYLLRNHKNDDGIMRGAYAHVNLLHTAAHGKRRGRKGPNPKDTLETWDLGWQLLKQARAAAAAAAAGSPVAAIPATTAAGLRSVLSSMAGGPEEPAAGAPAVGTGQQASSLTAAAVRSMGATDARSATSSSRHLQRVQSAASNASSRMGWSANGTGGAWGDEGPDGGGAGRGAVMHIAGTLEQQVAELLDLQECRQAALLRGWRALRERLKKSQSGLTLCLPILLLFLRNLLPDVLKQQYISWYRSGLGASGLQQLDALLVQLLDPHGFLQQIPLLQGSKVALQLRHGLQWQQKLAAKSTASVLAAADAGEGTGDREDTEGDDGSEYSAGADPQRDCDTGSRTKGAGGAAGGLQVSTLVSRAVGVAGSPRARQLLGAATCRGAARRSCSPVPAAASAAVATLSVPEQMQLQLAEQAMSTMTLNAGRGGGRTELSGRLRADLHSSRCLAR